MISPTHRPKLRNRLAATSSISKRKWRHEHEARSVSAANVRGKLRLDESVPLDAERLLSIAMRELKSTQEEFKRVARRLEAATR